MERSGFVFTFMIVVIARSEATKQSREIASPRNKFCGARNDV